MIPTLPSLVALEVKTKKVSAPGNDTVGIMAIFGFKHLGLGYILSTFIVCISHDLFPVITVPNSIRWYTLYIYETK